MNKGLEHNKLLLLCRSTVLGLIMRMIFKRTCWIFRCNMFIFGPSKLLLKSFPVVNKT